MEEEENDAIATTSVAISIVVVVGAFIEEGEGE